MKFGLSYILLLPVLLLSKDLKSQRIMLGKSVEDILVSYNDDPEYVVKIDTIDDENLLIKCHSANTYPIYIFQVNRLLNSCISHVFVSRNKDIFNTYVQILQHAGTLLSANEDFTEFTYMLDLSEKHIYYSIKRPFTNSAILDKRNLFYMTISEKNKKR